MERRKVTIGTFDPSWWAVPPMVEAQLQLLERKAAERRKAARAESEGKGADARAGEGADRAGSDAGTTSEGRER